MSLLRDIASAFSHRLREDVRLPIDDPPVYNWLSTGGSVVEIRDGASVERSGQAAAQAGEAIDRFRQALTQAEESARAYSQMVFSPGLGYYSTTSSPLVHRPPVNRLRPAEPEPIRQVTPADRAIRISGGIGTEKA